MPIDFQMLSESLSDVPEFIEPEIGSPAIQSDGSGFGGIAEATQRINGQYFPSPEEESATPVFKLPEIVDSATFTASELPEPDTLIEGLIHKGTKVIIGGGSKSFKTWVQLDLALCVAYGEMWLGHKTIPGRVLFVNFEIQPAFFQRRIIKIAEARGIVLQPDRLDIWNLRGFSAPYRLILPKIIERIKSSNYCLIVLDPIYKLYGSTNENDASEVAELMNALEEVCVKTGSAILFGAHYSKGNQSSKESIDRVSGSGVFARDPDTIIPFTRHEEEGSFVIEPTLRNLPPIQPFVVTWNYPLMERNDTLDPAALKQPGGRPKHHSGEDLLKVLGNGLGGSEWSSACATAGISRATYFRVKKELLDAKRVCWSAIYKQFRPCQPIQQEE